MLTELYTKVKSLVGDFGKSSFEIFEYTTTNIFTIATNNITITKVLINNVETSDYSFDSTTNKITISASGLASTDKLEVDYTYFSYSDTELKEYIRAALVWISIYAKNEGDYEIEAESVYPTPDNATEDLIAIIASILIKPNYNRKSLSGGITIVYPKNMPKEKVIESLIIRYHRGIGVTGLITLE